MGGKSLPLGEGSIITSLFPSDMGWSVGVCSLWYFSAAAMKPLNSGWARFGRLLNSGVELGTQVEVTAWNLDSLDQAAVRAGACNDQALFLKLGAELVVELIAVAMALVDVQRRSTRPSLVPGVMVQGTLPRRIVPPFVSTPC